MPAEVVEKDITSRMERWPGRSPEIEKQLSKSIMGVSIVTNYYGEDIEPTEAMANTSYNKAKFEFKVARGENL